MKKKTLKMKNAIPIIFALTFIGCENKTDDHNEALIENIV